MFSAQRLLIVTFVASMVPASILLADTAFTLNALVPSDKVVSSSDVLSKSSLLASIALASIRSVTFKVPVSIVSASTDPICAEVIEACLIIALLMYTPAGT